MDELKVNNSYFVQARDPSIISGFLGTSKIQKKQISRKKLLPLLNSTEINQQSTNSIEAEVDQEENCYHVFLRLKPTSKSVDSNLYELENNTTFVCKTSESNTSNSHLGRNYREIIYKKYPFDYIFDEKSDQKKIFDSCLKGQILNFINGRSSTLMTYGASGSGKTFTILGDSNDPGLIPRSLEYLFRTLPKSNDVPALLPLVNGKVVPLDQKLFNLEIEKTTAILNSTGNEEHLQHARVYNDIQYRLSDQTGATLPETNNLFSVWVSFFEIYNESIFDLLTPTAVKDTTKLKLALGKENTVYVKNLTNLYVHSGQEAYELLQHGINKLKYAATSVNKHSSRSHCIFTIRLLQSDSNGKHVRLSHFNFCDLAGSERAKETENVGVRLTESNNINKSLLNLSNCLKMLLTQQTREHSKHIVIPYRQSKLTQYLKQPLSGHEPITLIVNLNLSANIFDVTHVLNFSTVAKNIVVREEKPARRLSKFAQYLNDKNKQSDSLMHMSAITESVATGNNSGESELDAVLDENARLKEMIEFLKDRMIKSIAETREEVCNDYRQLMVENDAKWEKRLKNAVKLAREEVRLDLEEEINSRGKRRRTDDSDNDDVVEDYEANFKYLKRNYEEKISKLQEELSRLRNEHSELLTAAEMDFNTLQKKYDELETMYKREKERRLECEENNRDLMYQLEQIDDNSSEDKENIEENNQDFIDQIDENDSENKENISADLLDNKLNTVKKIDTEDSIEKINNSVNIDFEDTSSSLF